MIINSGEITTLILSGTAVLLDSEVEYFATFNFRLPYLWEQQEM